MVQNIVCEQALAGGGGEWRRDLAPSSLPLPREYARRLFNLSLSQLTYLFQKIYIEIFNKVMYLATSFPLASLMFLSL